MSQSAQRAIGTNFHVAGLLQHNHVPVDKDSATCVRASNQLLVMAHGDIDTFFPREIFLIGAAGTIVSVEI